MRFPSLLRVEFGRMLRMRRTQICMLLAALSPILGFGLFRSFASQSVSGYENSLHVTYLGNPAFAGALFGAILFAILTAMNLHDRHRYQTAALTDSIHSAASISLAQTLSLLALSVVTQVVTLLLFLPLAMHQIGAIFSLALYVKVYGIIMLPALLFAVLFTASVYQLTQRLDFSLVLFAAFLLLSVTAFSEDWLLRWVLPAVPYLSDDFANTRILMSVLYERLFMALLLLGIWSLSFLGIRRYGKNLVRSIVLNLRRVYLPIVAGVLLVSSAAAYVGQPFLDHSPELVDDSAMAYAEYSELTCSSIHVNLRPNFKRGSMDATAVYQIQNPTGKPRTEAFEINPGYTISSATANGVPIATRDLQDDNMRMKHIEVDLPADADVTLTLTYGGFPTEWSIMELMQGTTQISKEYLYLAGVEFAPSGTFLPSDDFAFTANIDLPQGMTPVLFGRGITEQVGENTDDTISWNLHQDTMYVILYAGDYTTHQIDASGVQLEFVYSKKHERAMQENNVDDVLKNVFQYCISHFGTPQFMLEGSLKMIEMGSFGGGYAGDGASAMSEDSFGTQSLNDPLKGAAGSEVLAHEIIHQWWGLGNMFDQSDMTSPWSAEGLTVYTTYRLMKELYGAQYAKENYIDMWQKQVDAYYQNFYIRNPQYFELLPPAYQADIQNSFSQMRQYCEMPLMLLKAEKLVGGEEAFDAILCDMFNREFDEDYSNYLLTYDLFLEYCGLTKEDLTLG